MSREISKIHEEHRRGSLEELAAWYTAHPPKGEIVLSVAGADKKIQRQGIIGKEPRGRMRR